MSASSDDEEINRREVAWRVFASEFRDADYSYAESDEERAPNYVVTPTGARVNRMFLVGVLTEVEYVSDDYVRARIVDPTGAFVVYAGQYQPDALTFLESAETPAFVAVTGKARTFQPEDSDVVYTSVRPESISEVDAETRDRWVVTTAEQTLERVATFADALDMVERGDDLRDALEASGVPDGLAAGIPLAISHYGTTEHYLAATRDLALDATRVVAGEIDEADRPMVDPGDEGDGTVNLPDYSLATEEAPPAPEPETEPVTEGAEAAAELETPSAPAAEEPTEAAAATDAETEPEPAAEPNAEETAEAAADEAAAETTTEPSDAEREPVEGFEPSDSESETETQTETEPVSQPESEPGGEPVEEPAEAAETAEAAGEDVAPEETDEMYELSEEEREEVEENFEVGFSTGGDVPEPGEVDIEPEAGGAEPDARGAEPEFESEEDATETEAEFAAEQEAGTETEEAEGGEVEDLEDVVVETMQAIGDGGGANREDIIETVADEYGVDRGDVEDAIQDALMAGRCFESGDDELTAI